jgi:tellurite resistance protein
MILMTLADGIVDHAELTAIASIYQQLSGCEIRQEDLRHEVDAAARDPRPVNDYLKEFGAVLNGEGKEIVLKAMFMIAVSDGNFDDSEFKLLADAARSLEVSKAHFNGIIAELTSRA